MRANTLKRAVTLLLTCRFTTANSPVCPSRLASSLRSFGSFGVAYHRRKRIAVPFVVGDGGPRIGESSVALARQVSGLSVTDEVTKQNRYAGQVDARDVLWIRVSTS